MQKQSPAHEARGPRCMQCTRVEHAAQASNRSFEMAVCGGQTRRRGRMRDLDPADTLSLDDEIMNQRGSQDGPDAEHFSPEINTPDIFTPEILTPEISTLETM